MVGRSAYSATRLALTWTQARRNAASSGVMESSSAGTPKGLALQGRNQREKGAQRVNRGQ